MGGLKLSDFSYELLLCACARVCVCVCVCVGVCSVNLSNMKTYWTCTFHHFYFRFDN